MCRDHFKSLTECSDAKGFDSFQYFGVVDQFLANVDFGCTSSWDQPSGFHETPYNTECIVNGPVGFIDD